ncbi:MAG: hypothetical protein QOE62_1340, partial [Actinomycetota bacterium]|nr:hypothetical protein [Actinomycetota bacterium]
TAQRLHRVVDREAGIDFAAGGVEVERDLDLPGPPDVVWGELPGILGDEVVHEAVPNERLSFRWISTDGDDVPSEVEITLEPSGVGTIVHTRETRLDGAHLVRSAFSARARARV